MQNKNRTGFSAKTTATFAALLIFLLPGCVGYQLGSMLPLDIQTVFIPTIVNETREPNVEGDITQALVEEIQKDGSLQVVNDPATADSILNVTLTDYELKPIDFDSLQKTRASEYRLLLVARVSLIRRATDEVIGEYPSVRGDTDFLFGGDLTTTKRNNLPDAAEDLAHDIIELIVETWE